MVQDTGQLHALSLVAALYAAAGDSAAFQGVLDRCHAWLRQPEVADTPAAAFLRRQLIRARATQGGTPAADGTAFAVISVDDRGDVLAAGPEAWAVLRCGRPDAHAITLPSALTRQLVEAGAVGGQLPRALRVPLDDGSGELAVVLLESSGVHHAVGVLRVATLLLCGLPAAPAADKAKPPARRAAQVQPFPATGTGPLARPPARRAAADD